MDVLLVESEPGLGADAARILSGAGHSVVRCVTGNEVGPCVGLADSGLCPLDHHEISVAVVARAAGELRPGEHGALCAARYRIPVVTTTDEAGTAPLAPIATPAGDDLLASVERAASSGSRHTAAVLRDLLRLGVVSRDDVEGENPKVAISVERSPRRLSMTIWLHPGDERASAIVKSATEALRRHDPHVAVVDVSVHRSDEIAGVAH